MDGAPQIIKYLLGSYRKRSNLNWTNYLRGKAKEYYIVKFISGCSRLHHLGNYISVTLNDIDQLLMNIFRRNSLEWIGVFNELN